MANELRRVLVQNPRIKKHENREADFHKWGQWGTEDGSEMMGVIEYDNGSCDYVPVDWIKFINKKKPEA